MRAIIGALIGLSVFVFLVLLDLDLEPGQHMLSAILALVVSFWIFEPIPIPVTALVGSILCVVLGVGSPEEVFSPYGDPIIFLFIGVFLFGEAVRSSSLDKRIASRVFCYAGSSLSFLILVCLITLFISQWMNNTAAAGLVIPLAVSILKRHRNIAPNTILGIAYAASIGGIGTPVGTVPNLIALGFLERQGETHIGFFDWCKVALPISLVILGIYIAGAVIFTRNIKLEIEESMKARFTLSECMVSVVFIMMVLGWILPGLLPFIGVSFNHKIIPEAVVGLGGAVALMIAPSSIRPYTSVLQWRQIRDIDWGTIFLFGGGLSLGGLIIKTGLGAHVANSILNITGVESAWGMLCIATSSSIILTEIMSNTAATNVIVPVIYSLAKALHLDPIPPVIASTLGASLAFLLPISTPPNAIAYGTGMVTFTRFIKIGFLMDILGFFVIVGFIWFFMYGKGGMI